MPQVYGWDDQIVRETDRELARMKAEEQDQRAAAAAAGELEVTYYFSAVSNTLPRSAGWSAEPP